MTSGTTPSPTELENGFSPSMAPVIEKTEQLDAPRPFTPPTQRQIIIAVIGLALCIFLAGLDMTIVATALPAIASDFLALDQIAWVITAYMLTASALQPVYGRLSDVFGRRATLLFAVITFLGGSVVCGAAPNVIVLIVFRAVAGLGGGGLISLSMIIISDMVPLKERSKYLGVISSMFGLSSVIGPLLGGVFVDHASWRWSFYVNLPVGGVAIVMLVAFIKFAPVTDSFIEKLKRIDFLGSILLIGSIICLLLGINWGGQTYPWNSATIIILLCIGLALMIIFAVVECKFAIDPIIPPSLFNRNTTSVLFITLLQGFVMFGSIYYLPMYFQIVQMESATMSGVKTLPFVLSMTIVSVVTGIIISKTGTFRSFMYAGIVFMSVGAGLISTLTEKSNLGMQLGYQLFIGVGLGLELQPILISSQAHIEPRLVAVVTAVVSFARQLGGILGVAIQSSILNTYVENYLSTRVSHNVAAMATKSVSLLSQLSAHDLSVVKEAYVGGLGWVFISLIPFALASLLTLLPLQHKSLKAPGNSNSIPNIAE